MNFYQSADTQYNTIVNDVLQNGYYSMDRTGTGTLKLTAKEMRFKPAEEFPIITTKPMDKLFELALKERFWIYQDQSNDVELLKSKYGVNIWNEWANERGDIGTAYGFQVKKHKQMERLIKGLIENPSSRRHRVQLWSEEDAPDMELEPCAFMTLWTVRDDTLDMTLIQRSGDLGLGIPFNMCQYAEFHMTVAKATGYKVGEFVHFIQDAHIYVNHINPLRRQMQREPKRKIIDDPFDPFDVVKLLPHLEITKDAPTDKNGNVQIESSLKWFYNLKPEDYKINNLVCHEEPVKMKVSV